MKDCGWDVKNQIKQTNIFIGLSLTQIRLCLYRIISGLCQSCGGVLSSMSGQIVSPDNDNDGIVDRGVECVWAVQAEGKTIELQIVTTDIRITSDDYVEACYYEIVVI